MTKQHYRLLERIASECAGGREVSFSGADFEAARRLVSLGLAEGDLDLDATGAECVAVERVTTAGHEALDEWRGRGWRLLRDILVPAVSTLLAYAAAEKFLRKPCPCEVDASHCRCRQADARAEEAVPQADDELPPSVEKVGGRECGAEDNSAGNHENH